MYNATDGHGAGLQRGGNAMPGKQKGQVVNRPHGNNKVAEHFRKYYQLWLLALPGCQCEILGNRAQARHPERGDPLPHRRQRSGQRAEKR